MEEEFDELTGLTKLICRRLIITRVEYVYKKPSEVTPDELPVAELEQVVVDERNPQHDKYNPSVRNGYLIKGNNGDSVCFRKKHVC